MARDWGDVEMKRVLIVSNNLYSGGIGKFLTLLLNKTKFKSEVTFVSRDKVLEGDMKQLGITNSRNIIIPKVINFWPFKEVLFFLRGLTFFKKEKKYDLIIVNYPLFIPAKIRNDARMVSIFHSLHKQYFNSSTPKRLIFFVLKSLHFLLIPIDWWRVKNSDKVICISEECFNLINKKEKIWYPNYPEKKLFFQGFRNKKRDNEINVLFVGREDPFKGLDLFEKLIKNINKEDGYRNLTFTIIGSKKLRERYNNVKLKGSLSFKETIKEFSNADVFVSTSYIENMPNVIWEAIENGAIPLVSDVGDCKKMVGSINDFVFKSNDLEDLQRKFKELISQLPQKRRKLKELKKVIERTYFNKDLFEVINE